MSGSVDVRRQVSAGRAETRQPAPAEPETRQDLEWQVAEDTGGLWRVIIHNDDVTPMDFVIAVLRQVFELGLPMAERVMLTAHFTGRAVVAVMAREEAKERVGRAHGHTRAAGDPLTFTIEPE